jgi:signal transduction histidine kinase
MVKRLAAGRERSSQIGGGTLSVESDSTGTKVEAVLPRAIGWNADPIDNVSELTF